MHRSSLNNIHSAISFTFSFKKKYNIIGCSKIILFLILVSNSVLAQTENKIYYYENGNVSSEGKLENGLPNGYWKTYYPNGQIKSEGNRENFELDSTWVFYNELGQKMSVINYRNGRRNGIVETYENGVLLEVSNYLEDEKVGETTIYYPTGEEKRKIPFEAGRENGRGYEFDLDGRIITILEYRDGNLRTVEKVNRRDNQGKKRGPWITFYPDGIVSMEGYYMNDLKNGIFKYYNRNGDLINLEKYRDGALVTDSEASVILDIRNTY